MCTICTRVPKSCFPPHMSSVNSPLLQGNEEGFRLNTETSKKNRWGSSLREVSYLPALKSLSVPYEDILVCFP